MLQAYSSATLDFGLFVYEQKWLGIFTAGFDGKRLHIEAVRRDDGMFDAFLLANTVESQTFPPLRGSGKPKVGLIELVSHDADKMILRFALDRFLLGWPAVDFSPMPERDHTGTIELSRVV